MVIIIVWKNYILIYFKFVKLLVVLNLLQKFLIIITREYKSSCVSTAILKQCIFLAQKLYYQC